MGPSKLNAWTEKFWTDHRQFARDLFDPRIQGVARLLDGPASPDFVNVFVDQYVEGRHRRKAEDAERFEELGRLDVSRVGQWVTCARATNGRK